MKLPRVRNGRDRIASPHEAERLRAALPETELAISATAMYAGLRRGELQALRVSNVRLADGMIDVEAGWDYKEGLIATKGLPRSSRGVGEDRQRGGGSPQCHTQVIGDDPDRPAGYEYVQAESEVTVDELLDDPLPAVRESMTRVWQYFGHRPLRPVQRRRRLG